MLVLELFLTFIFFISASSCKAVSNADTKFHDIQTEAKEAGLDENETKRLALFEETCRRETGSRPFYARIVSRSGSETRGLLMVRADQNGHLKISGALRGLKPLADHGFHIHENGSCDSSDALSAGGHYNPEMKPHGPIGQKESHAGDLGNIKADSTGKAWVEVQTFGINLSDIANRSFIIHRDPDDFKTQPTGNAGPRIGCGVIREDSGKMTPRRPSEFVIQLQAKAPPAPQIKGRFVAKEVLNGLEVTGSMEGLVKATEYTAYFHENPKKTACSGDFSNVGAAFNPMAKSQEDLAPSEGLVSLLGHFKADHEGKATLKTVRKGLGLTDPNIGVLGRALVIHMKPENVKNSGTQTSGNSGARVACGIVQ